MTTGVVYSRRAAAEAEEIEAFLAEHSRSAAERLRQSLNRAEQRLVQFPDSGAPGAVAQRGDRLAPRMQAAALAERDQPLDNRPQILCLGQRRADLLMLQQRRGHVLEHRLAVRGSAAEAAAALSVAHIVVSPAP